MSYPYIFKMVQYDQDDNFQLTTDCSSGLMSMMIVCARSMSMQKPADDVNIYDEWFVTTTVVEDEGNSVEDFQQPMEYRECRKLCEANTECKSLAHGPFGCHLKDKCVNLSKDQIRPMTDFPAPEEVYRTHYKLCEPDYDNEAEVDSTADSVIVNRKKKLPRENADAAAAQEKCEAYCDELDATTNAFDMPDSDDDNDLKI